MHEKNFLLPTPFGSLLQQAPLFPLNRARLMPPLRFTPPPSGPDIIQLRFSREALERKGKRRPQGTPHGGPGRPGSTKGAHFDDFWLPFGIHLGSILLSFACFFGDPLILWFLQPLTHLSSAKMFLFTPKIVLFYFPKKVFIYSQKCFPQRKSAHRD